MVVSGQCDSPGYSAKNLCYFLMGMETDYIIDLHIADKRQTDLKSVNMEREALRVILNRLKNVLDIGEVVTDASFSIIKMLGEYNNSLGNTKINDQHRSQPDNLVMQCKFVIFHFCKN